MSQVTVDKIVKILKEFVNDRQTTLEIILVGGLALQHYGMKDRATIDIDAEIIKGGVEDLFNFLKLKGIPSDLGEDISGWSVVAMPEGYRKRTITIHKEENLIIKVLHPVDFVIAKLRRAMEVDLEDALFVVKRFGIRQEEIKEASEEAIRNSPKDTALFVFRRGVALFLKRLEGVTNCIHKGGNFL